MPQGALSEVKKRTFDRLERTFTFPQPSCHGHNAAFLYAGMTNNAGLTTPVGAHPLPSFVTPAFAACL